MAIVGGGSEILAQKSPQFMSEQGFEEIPALYVRVPSERSNLSETDAEGVPVIDLAKDGPAEIGKACREWGLFLVRTLAMSEIALPN